MPYLNRCGACRQPGHNRRCCPHSEERAAELFEAHRRETLEAARRRREEEAIRRSWNLVRVEGFLYDRSDPRIVESQTVPGVYSLRGVPHEHTHTQNADRLWEEGFWTNGVPQPPQYVPTPVPQVENKNQCQETSKCKTEIQSILFENADKMPDGLYVQLMNALMIKD